jgi:hypothetical protein
MKPAWSLWLILATPMISASNTSLAQQDKVTRIHVTFSSYYERIRPGYGEGTSNEEMNIVLSGNNHIQETSKSTNSLASQSWSGEHTLGDEYWHVSGPHTLIKIQKMSQSVRSTTIEVIGNTCKASWRMTLLPGYKEYYFYSISIKDFAYYRQARMISSTCEIESN